MRKLRLLAAVFAATALLAGCEKDDNGGGTEPAVTVDFESAQLLTQTGNYTVKYDDILWGADKAEEMENGDNVYDGIVYTEDGADFGSYYNDYASGGYPGDYWGGFAVSSNDNKENLGMDYSNQFSVYASTATKFAIGYDVSYTGSTAEYDKPTIKFTSSCTVASARIANANKTYHYCVDNPKGAAGEQDILFELVATGYKADAATGTVKVTLANGADVLADWKEVSFTPLGEVDRIVFSFESNDVGSMGNNVPSFFCIDDIKIKTTSKE
jgi:nitrous oxide reductase accessory protein NosL